MPAGSLRLVVDIQAKSETKDTSGAPSSSWSTIATVRGSRRDLGGNALFASGKLASETASEVVIRYNTTVTAAHRLVIDGVNYDIRFIAHDDHKVWTTLTCARGMNNG